MYIKRLTFLLLIVVLGASPICADVDLTFNAQLQTTAYDSKNVQHLLKRSDGKIIAAGLFNTYNGTPVSGLVCLNPDGTLDQSFNNNLDIDVPKIYRLYLESNDKLVIVLQTSSSPVKHQLRRLTADGNVDTIQTSFDGYIGQAAMDSLGRIYAYGSMTVLQNGTPVTRSFVRFNNDGSLDNSFQPPAISALHIFAGYGNQLIYTNFDIPAQQYRLGRLNEDGSIDNNFQSSLVQAFTIMKFIVQADAKVLVLAHNRVFRINSDGSPDSTFAFQGPISGGARDLFLHSNGNVTVVSHSETPFGEKVIRLLPNGGPDTQFAPFYFLGEGYASSVVDAEDGIVIADLATSSSVNRFLRVLSTGLQDPAFNSGGTGFQSLKPGIVQGITPLADGKILIGGDFDKIGTTFRSKAARLNADSSIDPSFQLNTTPGGNYFSQLRSVYDMVPQSDGRILVSGNFEYFINGSQRAHIVRLNSDGSIDATFFPPSVLNLYASSGMGTGRMVQRSDNKIAVGTSRPSAPTSATTPLILLSNGTKDPTSNPGFFNDKDVLAIHDIAALPNGKILISGKYRRFVPDVQKGFIAQLNANGTVDASFSIYETDRTVYAFSVLANGQIVMALQSTTASTLARLNPNGTLDPTFAAGTGANGKINTLAVLASGDIAVGGLFTTYDGQTRQNLARLRPDGTLGPSIGNINKEVFCLKVDGQGRLLVGGQFTVITVGTQQSNISYLLRMEIEETRLPRAPFDVDGDGRSDVAVFRPENGTWYVLKSQTGAADQFQFGANGDVPVDADFDGDFKADHAVWRPSTGEWYWRQSSNGAFGGALWGGSGDRALPADYDGDGKTDLAVWRASDGLNYIVKSSGGFLGVQWGTVGDVPSHADLNGDGKTDFAVFRPSNGTWYTLINGTSTSETFQFGQNGDIPVRGDIDGDGKGDIIVWRPSTAEWFYRRSSNGTFGGLQWGANGDRPVPGDYDGDGRTDFGVWRSTDGIHYIVKNSGGFLGVQWGAAGDHPVLGSPPQ